MRSCTNIKKVKCIDCSDSCDLTIGEVYDVCYIDEVRDDVYFVIFNDKGIQHGYHEILFEFVEV